jgi:hypothetical protein
MEKLQCFNISILTVCMLHPIREIAQFMNGAEHTTYRSAQFLNWAENEQRIAQFVNWASVEASNLPSS